MHPLFKKMGGGQVYNEYHILSPYKKHSQITLYRIVTALWYPFFSWGGGLVVGLSTKRRKVNLKDQITRVVWSDKYLV